MSTTAIPRDPRVQQMIDDPVSYFAEARKKARADAEAALEREKKLRKQLRKKR